MRVMLAIGRIDDDVVAHLPAARRLAAGGRDLYQNSTVATDIEAVCRAHQWQVDIAKVGAGSRQEFAAPDVVVNLVSEPLICDAALSWLDRFARDTRLPVLNTVAATRRACRTALPATLAGQAGVRVPRSTRFIGRAGDLPAHIERAGHSWPVLTRPPGTHGSDGLIRHLDTRLLLADPDRVVDRVVSDFVDTRGPDGLYRKYRMVWADGRVFRRHAIAATHWNVNGPARIDMVGRHDLIAAEKAFIAGADSTLDGRVTALFRAVGLDVAVIDFAIDPAGDLVVFELNGTFQISGSIPDDKRPDWGYLETGNATVANAILSTIARLVPRHVSYGVAPLG
ncbi:MAG: hypothetical protein SFV21_16925 [Rhodospirillaceae bacterium]|nr:hypothetical protein [Rhodospirillaceae bacterium]